MITSRLYYYCEKLFTLMNIWRTWKNSMKLHYLKKEYFYSTLNVEGITDVDYTHAKKVFVKILK